ncbi:hypothetical protein PRIPAC_81588, partial [Pristionchus pacificus]|uniref:G protein-coupled receptor n=1 Tax=Pristionchus pacificus TaxID=54126 RepID=A0A2A6CMZ3_PRIPA
MLKRLNIYFESPRPIFQSYPSNADNYPLLCWAVHYYFWLAACILLTSSYKPFLPYSRHNGSYHTQFNSIQFNSSQSDPFFLIVTSFCHRIYILRREPPSTIRTLSICAVSFIPNAIWLMVFSTSQDDSKLVVEALRIARPTYSVDSYLVEGKNNLMFTRYLDVFSPTVILFIGTTCAPLFPAFLLFFALRRKA